MSLEVKAAHTRKQLLKWLQSEALSFGVIGADDRKRFENSLTSSAKAWEKTLCYEVGSVTVGTAVAALVAALEALAIERIVVWMGQATGPLVVDLSVSDLHKVLEHAAETESVLTLSTADCCGYATVVMPTMEDDFLISGAGQMEPLVEEVQRRCPGGGVFRGESC